jgi:competence protein ComEC
VQVFNSLPGNSVAVGTISLVQLLLLYALLGITCIIPPVRRRWWLAGLVAVALVAFPVLQNQISQFQVTVLATSGEQILVILDKGSVSLVNSGEADTASFTVLPFLQKQGVNQIDVALSLDKQPHLRSGWSYILQSLPIRTFYDSFEVKQPSAKGSGKYDNVSPSAIASAIKSQEGNYQLLSAGQKISAGSTTLELIQVEPAILQLQIRNLTWLLLGEIKLEDQQQLVKTGNLRKVQVLCWSGKSLSAELLDVLSPQFAIAQGSLASPIASSDTVDLETAKLLRNKKIQLYWTGRDGAIQWTAKSGFSTTLEDLIDTLPE